MFVCCNLIRHRLTYDKPKLQHLVQCYYPLFYCSCVDITVFYLDKVCFGKRSYSVDEGERIQVDLILSRTLPYPLTVQLDYTDMQTKISKLISV